MKRSLISCILAVLVILSAAPAPGLSQTPVAFPAATPDPFALPVNLRIIRIHRGNGFDFLRLPPGTPLRVNTYLINDGQATVPVPSSLEDTYAALRIDDMYVAYAVLMSEGMDDPMMMVTVDIRLLTFPDGDAASTMVETSLDVLESQAREDPSASRDLGPMSALPSHDEQIAGVTGTDPLINATTGAPVAIRMPFTRFFAQDGATVASVKVGSMDPAFNDAVAQELLTLQLHCLSTNVFCSPVPLPAGMSFAPPFPGATPVAMLLQERPLSETPFGTSLMWHAACIALL